MASLSCIRQYYDCGGSDTLTHFGTASKRCLEPVRMGTQDEFVYFEAELPSISIAYRNVRENRGIRVSWE